MYTKHFFRMLFGLIGMGVLGLIVLFLINSYYKEQTGHDAPLPVSTYQGSSR